MSFYPPLSWFLATTTLIALLGYWSNAVAMNLSDFIVEVVQSDPKVREQIHAYRQVVQDHEIALSGWRPSLDLTASSGEHSQAKPTNSNFSSSQVDLTLSQNLFNGFDTTNQIEQTKSRITSAVYQILDTADNSALEAVKAYLSVLSEQKLLVLAKQNVRSHERILSQILEQLHGGIGRRSDIEQTEGRLASARASLISQQNNLQDALTQIHKVLGRHVDPSSLTTITPPPIPRGEIEELTDQALANHPALESARRNISAARSDYQRSKHTNFPRLDLQLQQSVGDNLIGESGPREEGSVFLTLSYNFYRGGADLAAQRKKISAMQQNEAFRSLVRRQIIDNLRLAWNADHALQEQLPYLKQHVEKAQQALELYLEEFMLNKRDLIDVLDAESELNNAQKKEVQGHYDMLIARFRIYEGLGRLFESLGLAVEATDMGLQLASIDVQMIDAPETDQDIDQDGHSGDNDQCDNTPRSQPVNEFGCVLRPEQKFGYHQSNTSPVATNDTFSTAVNTALDIASSEILANDSDPDGDKLKLEHINEPTRGSVTMDADGYLIYAPPRQYFGTDEFTYTVSDGQGGESTAKVIIQIGETQNSTLPAVETLHFLEKQLILTPASQQRLEQLVPILLHADDVRIELRGYTDNLGDGEYNLRFSERRAQTLRRQLIDSGISEQRIHAVGMGEADPVADNSSAEGRAQNRRVELYFKQGAED